MARGGPACRRAIVWALLHPATAASSPPAQAIIKAPISRYAFAGGGSATVRARTPAYRGSRGPPAGCVERRVGDAHPELGNTDEVYVTRCGPPPITNSSSVAACVPTVYGDYLATGRGRRWVTDVFLRHYRRLRVARFFVYAASAPSDGHLAADATVVHVSWLNGCRAAKTHPARCAYATNRSIMHRRRRRVSVLPSHRRRGYDLDGFVNGFCLAAAASTRLPSV